VRHTPSRNPPASSSRLRVTLSEIHTRHSRRQTPPCRESRVLTMPGRSEHSTNRRPRYVSYSNPVNAGRSPYHGKPSIETRTVPTTHDGGTRKPPATTQIPCSPHNEPTRPESGQHRRALQPDPQRRPPRQLTLASRDWDSTAGVAARGSGHLPKSPCQTARKSELGHAKCLQDDHIVCLRGSRDRRHIVQRYRTTSRGELGQGIPVGPRNLASSGSST
jgi:hypothetical protein